LDLYFSDFSMIFYAFYKNQPTSITIEDSNFHSGPWTVSIPYICTLGLQIGPQKDLRPCNWVLGQKGAARPVQFRRACRCSRPGKGRKLVIDLPGLDFVAWTGRGGGPRGNSAAHGGGGRCDTNSDEEACAAKQCAVARALGGPRGELSVAGWHSLRVEGKLVGRPSMAGGSRAQLRSRGGRGGVLKAMSAQGSNASRLRLPRRYGSWPRRACVAGQMPYGPTEKWHGGRLGACRSSTWQGNTSPEARRTDRRSQAHLGVRVRRHDSGDAWRRTLARENLVTRRDVTFRR
jgi:hypothetical protein